MNKYSEILKTLIVVLFLNFTVSLLKITFGLLTGVLSVLSDGIHSFTDSLINIIGIISTRVAKRPPDEKHPYGYEKYETIATNIMAALTFLMGFEILKEGVSKILFHPKPEIKNVSLNIITLLITISINIITALYENRKGKKLKSEFLVADSLGTVSDIFVSLGVLIGILGIMKGFLFLDPFISIGIGIIILYNGFRILKETTGILVDISIIPPEEICKVVSQIPEVKFAHAIRSRGKKDAVYVDIHIGVEPHLTVETAHDVISHKVKEKLSENFPNIKYVNIHIEPDNEKARKRKGSVFKKKDKYAFDCEKIFIKQKKENI